MKRKIKENIKIIIAFVVGVTLTLSISVTAEQQIESAGVTYTTKTGKVETVNKTLDNLITLSDTYTTDFKTEIKKELLNETYPKGSIYISTELSTKEAVAAKFGGTWEVYGQGRTLVGANSTFSVNTTGGSITKSGTFKPNVTISDYNGSTGGHTLTKEECPPQLVRATSISNSNAWSLGLWGAHGAGTVAQIQDNEGFGGYGRAHSHSMNHSHTLTNNTSTISVEGQDPYTVVYMYRRTA